MNTHDNSGGTATKFHSNKTKIMKTNNPQNKVQGDMKPANFVCKLEYRVEIIIWKQTTDEVRIFADLVRLGRRAV